MYRNTESIGLVMSARDFTREWTGWEHFNKALSPKEMVQLASNLGLPIGFKKGTKEDLSMEVWMKMSHIADDRRSAADCVPDRDALTGKVKGQRGRKKQNLSGRLYTIKPIKGGDRKTMLNDCPCTTRQARKIWEFFVDEYLRTKSKVITEGRMQDIVNDRADELQTRQDPWRIFQYYRPELMDCQLIRFTK
jgi:hypothetical protein